MSELAQNEPIAPQPPPVGTERKKMALRPEGRLPKVLRVGAFTIVVGSLIAFGQYQRVRGQVSESLLGAGAQMMMLEDADRQDEPRALHVNGQVIRFSSGMVSQPMEAVLDRFELQCNRLDGGLMETLGDAFAERSDHRAAERVSELEPILREQSETSGFVACIDMGSSNADLQRMLERFRRFERSRDLADLGELRYVYAEPAGERTHFVALWTEGSLRFDQLFPETGDAPGEDPADIPRPPGARRVLTAFEEGDPQRATFYLASDLDESGLESFYRRELPASGWTVLDASDDPRAQARARARDGRPALVAQHGDRTVFFALSTDDEGRGQAAVLESGEADGG